MAMHYEKGSWMGFLSDGVFEESIQVQEKRQSIQVQEKRQSLKNQVGGDHYVSLSVQPVEVIESFGPEQAIGFYKGNVVKYLMRWDKKDTAIQNARKALDYMKRLVEFMEMQGNGDAK